MAEIKDSLKSLASEIEDLLTEVEDSDEFINEDQRAEVFEALEDAQSLIADAIMAV